jgi:RimJ/RimL family protein N-acetyltransferase
MVRIEKVEENRKQALIDLLKTDILRHVFAVYDMQYEPQYTTVYAAFEGAELKGYVLIYTAMDFPSVILECEPNIAGRLVEYAPERFIMHASENLWPIVKAAFPNAKHYMEEWMFAKKEHANFFKSDFVRRLNIEDAKLLATLLASREDRPARPAEKYADWITKQPLYGVFVNGELVAYAGSFLQLPQVWMIGGVYTHPTHRNKGYATLAVSKVTEQALRNAEAAALFVRSDNYPAIRAYEKIGYKKIGEKLWVDMGTGLRP